MNRKVPVTERAVIQRINRKLKPDYQAVRKARPDSSLERSVGTYYVLDYNRNFILDTNVDIEQLGRELGVLSEWEQLEED